MLPLKPLNPVAFISDEYLNTVFKDTNNIENIKISRTELYDHYMKVTKIMR